MRAGDLRRRIDIQVRSSGQDSYGQQLSTWSNLLTNVPAMIEPLSGRELEIAAANHPQVDTRITVRYHPALANPAAVSSYRAVYANAGGARYYNIGAVINLDERNRTIELMVSSGANEGG